VIGYLVVGLLSVYAPVIVPSTLPQANGYVFSGDSITQGVGGSASYPDQFTANTGKNSVNIGQSGDTAQDANTNYATQIAPSYNASTANALILLYGTNDLGALGHTDTQLRSDVVSIIGKARATGYYAVVGTLLPRNDVGNGWNSTMEGYRLAYDAWLRGNFQTFANALIDFGGISDMQNPNDFHYADTLHPENRGMRLMAELVRTRFGIANVNDVTPSSFSFTPVTSAARSTVFTSGAVELSGFTAPAAISITGGTYSVNGGAFTASAGTVSPYDQVQVQLTSSSSGATQVTATLTVGGVNGSYSVTTA
jgi:lysophospholipase L1-like esterase